MAKTRSEVENWLAQWASDNLYEGYTDSSASMEQAASNCLSAAEEDGILTEAVLTVANDDLVQWLRDFKAGRLEDEG
jgi:hypothetical protein